VKKNPVFFVLFIYIFLFIYLTILPVVGGRGGFIFDFLIFVDFLGRQLAACLPPSSPLLSSPLLSSSLSLDLLRISAALTNL
jgi:hypothetical protein